MTPGELVIGFYQRMFKIWWPVLILISAMLIALIFSEGRDKHGRYSDN